VTSHLTVTAPPPDSGLASAGNSGGAGKAAHPLGAFGAILDTVHAVEAAATGNLAGGVAALTGSGKGGTPKGFVHLDTAAATPDPGLAALKQLLPGGATLGSDGSLTASLAATGTAASPGDATATDGAGTPPKLLHELVSALTDLEKAVAAGKPADKDLLKRIEDALDALSAFLLAQHQPALAAPGAAAAPADGIEAVGAVSGKPGGTSKTDAAAALAAARQAAGKLADRMAELSTALGKDQAALAGKLGDFAKALSSKGLDATTLAQLGLQDTGTDPDLATAINNFLNGKPAATADATPKLAIPALQLPDNSALKPAKAADTGVAPAAAAKEDARPPAPAAASTDATRHDATDDQGKPAPDSGSADATPGPRPAHAAAPAPANPAPPAAAAIAAVTPANAGLRQAQDAYQPPAPLTVNLPQMAFEIVRHAQLGANRFDIRLDPADLGRVDVRLAIDGTGVVNAHLTVERPDTLDLLRRDAGALGQALTQAGLDAGKTNLQFSLSQNPFTRQDGRPDPGGYSPPSPPAPTTGGAADPAVSPAITTVYRGTASPSGLNIFV
jgi:flagellar hook-length control protein FliK